MFSFCYTGRMYIMTDTLKCSELYLVIKFLSMKAPQLVAKANFVIFVIILLISIVVLSGKRTRDIVNDSKWNTSLALKMAMLFGWSVIALSGVSTFLYFNF